MKHLKQYESFLNEKRKESPLQKEYREFFSNLLDLYGVKSPRSFGKDKAKAKKFYKDIEKGWSKGNGTTQYGKDLFKKKVNEKNEEDTEYVLKIDNEYSKLKVKSTKDLLDLGELEEVSDIDIKNIQKRYPDSELTTKNGHYWLKVI